MEQEQRKTPVMGLAIIVVAVLLLISYAGYSYYQTREETRSDEDKELRSPVHSFVVMTIEFKGKEHEILLKLYEDKAPRTCANFRHYVEEGFYDNTTFHRVIADFIVQGGGQGTDGNMKEPDREALQLEQTGLKNSRGSISMARLEGPNTATSQFFFNVQDNPSLNPGGVDKYGYAVFGVVTDDDFPIIEQMSNAKTDENDEPLEQIILVKARMQ